MKKRIERRGAEGAEESTHLFLTAFSATLRSFFPFLFAFICVDWRKSLFFGGLEPFRRYR